MAINPKFTTKLNMQGIFFEAACLEFINSYPTFIDKETEVPFTLPPYAGMEPISGAIDFLCLNKLEHKLLIYFIIEVKKANPSLKDWIFFKRYGPEQESIFFYRTSLKPSPRCGTIEPINEFVYDKGFQLTEAKPTQAFSDFKKDPIYNSTIQAFAGLKSIIYNDGRFKEAKEIMLEPVFYMPVVITTANLHVADFNPTDVDLKTGTINNDKVKYEAAEWVEYSAPVPEYLQIGKVDRQNIFIVNSNCLKKFIEFINQRFRFISRSTLNKEHGIIKRGYPLKGEM